MFFEWGMHQRPFVWLVVTVLAALLVSSCGGGGGQKDDASADTTTAGGGGQAPRADLDAALEKSFRQSSAPGMVAAVQTPEYTWIRAVGMADRASEKPMTPEMYHRIGSVTKTFTATLLLQAAGDGLLSLHDTIDQYVKGVPNGDEITLRQLATMTSGVATYSETRVFPGDPGADVHKVWKPEELVKIGIEDSPLFDPGTEFNYSNTNYVLLGLVLEQVTGESMGELTRKQIIEPLDLKDTSFPTIEATSLPDPHAQGYTLQGQSSGEKPRNATDWTASWTWTAGIMISTVDDLLVYGRALGTGKGLLSPTQQQERIDSLASDVPPFDQPPLEGDFGYGLGLMKEHGWIGHSGVIAGYNTALYYNQELDAVLVVETSSDIFSGDCPEERPTMKGGPKGTPCDLPASRTFKALARALGEPAPAAAQ
ncbi:MAG TPA: serine hydrolase domain-containing protein [Rubrobacter sp.]|nr:serine hydrolase domain-containing protein [Rubrobacter sp.]